MEAGLGHRESGCWDESQLQNTRSGNDLRSNPVLMLTDNNARLLRQHLSPFFPWHASSLAALAADLDLRPLHLRLQPVEQGAHSDTPWLNDLLSDTQSM